MKREWQRIKQEVSFSIFIELNYCSLCFLFSSRSSSRWLAAPEEAFSPYYEVCVLTYLDVTINFFDILLKSTKYEVLSQNEIQHKWDTNRSLKGESRDRGIQTLPGEAPLVFSWPPCSRDNYSISEKDKRLKYVWLLEHVFFRKQFFWKGTLAVQHHLLFFSFKITLGDSSMCVSFVSYNLCRSTSISTSLSGQIVKTKK